MGRPVLPDVLAPGLAVVFCGSAASAASARRRAYYAGPGNRFWPTLHAVGLTPELLRPEDFRMALRHGLGLTDLAKHVSGTDGALPPGADDAAAVLRKIGRVRPRAVAFVGKRAAEAVLGRRVAYGRQEERLSGAAVHVLPSPSGAARRYWDIGRWRALAREICAGD